MTESHDRGGMLGNSWLRSRTGFATLIAIAVLGFLIYKGHSAHLLGFLPYLLLLACPLMHVFMHGGHGDRHHKTSTRDNGQSRGNQP